MTDTPGFIIDVTNNPFTEGGDGGGGGPTPTVSWQSDNSFLAEGQGQTIVARMDPPTLIDAWVKVTAVGGTAQAEDYDFPEGDEIYFPAGSPVGFFQFSAIDDPDQEDAETVVLRLDLPYDAPDDPNNETREVIGDLGAPAEHTVTIAASDDAPDLVTISFDSGGASVQEDAGTVNWNLVLSEAATEQIRAAVTFVAPASTVTLDEDVTWVDSIQTFTPGQTSKPLSVTILDDADVEGTEVFAVRFTILEGPAVFGNFQGYIVTITDNDDPPAEDPVWSFQEATSQLEDGQTVQIPLVLEAGNNLAGSSVRVGVGGTALPADYNVQWPGGVDGVVDIPAGQNSAVITLEADDGGGGGGDPFPPLFDETNTGFSGALTAYTGGPNITTPGITLENLSFTGQINIRANNVTIRNCLFDSTPSGTAAPLYAINANIGQSGGPYYGLLVEDCTFRGYSSGQIFWHEGVVRRCHFTEAGSDAMKVQWTQSGRTALTEECFMERIGNRNYTTETGAHADGNQTRANDGGTTIFRRVNFALADQGSDYEDPNACSIIQAAESDLDGYILFDECYFEGGNFLLYFTLPSSSSFRAPSNWELRNNIFRTGSWVSGPIIYDSNATGDVVVITGNRRDDTGANVDAILLAQGTWS